MKKLERKTRRLVVRPLESSDHSSWKAAHSEMLPPLNAWDRKNRDLSELTEAKFKSLLRNQKMLREADHFFDLGVFLKSSGELIGGVSAMNIIRSVSQSSFLGYQIFNSYWGQGYGKEAVKAMLDIGFRDLRLHRMEAGVEPHNRRSVMLCKSLGFRKEGLKKRAVFLRGEWCDLVMYSLTCEDLGLAWQGELDMQTRPR